MRCHYDVLGIDLDADTQTLRAAYKKCALKWHPDKNLDNEEEAKKEFQIVQQAFEVLSDPHERAWYDNHREAILKGGIGEDYTDDSINLFPYFTTSCYQGYGDDEKGFYTVYREVFNKIYAEDFDSKVDEMTGDDSIPHFGKSDSPYGEVVHPFYAYWENYCTSKSYAWLDEFDTRQAPNRRVIRLMEKENKKLRDKARKQRNEEIRELVRFVRKRDKRIEKQRKHLEVKAAENAKKAQLNRLRQIEERKRMLAESTEADWAKMTNFESALQEIESNLTTEFGDNSSEEENAVENQCETGSGPLFCVACNKMFKTEKSFVNHENSKKHKEKLIAFVGSLEDVISDEDADNALDNSSHDEEISEEFTNKETLYNNQASKKKNKGKKVLKPESEFNVSNGSHDANCDVDDESDDSTFPEMKKNKKKRNAKKKNIKTTPNPVDNDESEVLQNNVVAENSEKSRKNNVTIAKDKVLRKNSNEGNNVATLNKSVGSESKDFNHNCAVCNSKFKSKNKLFDHLKTTGHAVNLSNAVPVNKLKSNSKLKNHK